MSIRRTGRAGSYGFDAPYVPLLQFLGGLAALAFTLRYARTSAPKGIVIWCAVWALLLFAMAASFVYATRRGKFRVWRDLVDRLALRGDERTLDLGCGRGLVLLEIARHLSTGRAVGVDLWRKQDQSGNGEDATLANARTGGVADRIELKTGDMTELPFADAAFDLVTASLAIHNIGSAAGRARAVGEAVRVLRPGGRILIADMRHTHAYATTLAELGMQDVAHRSLGWRFWFGGPFWATYLVAARKPG